METFILVSIDGLIEIAVYLQKSGREIEFNNEKYVIVPYSAILILIRDEERLNNITTTIPLFLRPY